MSDITEGQQRWLDRLWTAFGDPLSEMTYGVGHEGCARMSLNGLVFVVDRETNHVSVEIGGNYGPPSDFKDLMIWRDEHGLDGSYEATYDALVGDN